MEINSCWRTRSSNLGRKLVNSYTIRCLFFYCCMDIANLRLSIIDILSAYFIRPSKVWSMLHHGPVQNKISLSLTLNLILFLIIKFLFLSWFLRLCHFYGFLMRRKWVRLYKLFRWYNTLTSCKSINFVITLLEMSVIILFTYFNNNLIETNEDQRHIIVRV